MSVTVFSERLRLHWTCVSLAAAFTVPGTRGRPQGLAMRMANRTHAKCAHRDSALTEG